MYLEAAFGGVNCTRRCRKGRVTVPLEGHTGPYLYLGGAAFGRRRCRPEAMADAHRVALLASATVRGYRLGGAHWVASIPLEPAAAGFPSPDPVHIPRMASRGGIRDDLPLAGAPRGAALWRGPAPPA